MSPTILLIICAIIWGVTAFIQKLAADKMSPILMQAVVTVAFLVFIPFALKFGSNTPNFKWNITSVLLTFGAALLSIFANVLMYTALSNNKNTGSQAMLISLYPAVTLILSAIFLHEQFSTGKIIGFLAMVGGACLLTFC